jgi:hypothetical protein
MALAAPRSATLEDHGRIYVYAQRLTAASSWQRVSCGDAVVAELKQGTFFAINVPPGRYTLSPEKGVPASVDVRSGEESFVRLDWHYDVGRHALPELHTVRPEQAGREMKFLSYINPKKALSSSVSKTDPREPPQLRLKRRGDK